MTSPSSPDPGMQEKVSLVVLHRLRPRGLLCEQLATSRRSQEKRGCYGNRYINYFYSLAVEASFMEMQVEWFVL